MFRLVTFFISIVGFAAIVWFGVTVELGDRTLFGHLRAIGGSHEAQQLWDGTKGKVTDFVGIEAARRAEAAKEAFKHPPDKAAPAGTRVAPALERAPQPVVAHAPQQVVTRAPQQVVAQAAKPAVGHHGRPPQRPAAQTQKPK